MEVLNKKRQDLLLQSRNLNEKIAKKEEKKNYLVSRKSELEAREHDLNCKQPIQVSDRLCRYRKNIEAADDS